MPKISKMMPIARNILILFRIASAPFNG